MALFNRPNFFDRAKLPAELAALIGQSRPLASGASPEGAVFASAEVLAYQADQTWQQIAWHLIERGGWNQKTQRLSWTSVEGEPYELELTEPGRLPQVFKERVNASIACSVLVPLSDNRNAVISARRNLSEPDGALIWRVSPGKATSAAEVAEDPTVRLELARLRAEYDRG